MIIEHLAIYVNDLEAMKSFYCKYFNATSGDMYHNPIKKFKSYFLSFDTGCRLEIMHKEGIDPNQNGSKEYQGIVHFAISVGNKEKVDSLTDELRNTGHTVLGNPRTTGDGYYESVVMDPEGNRVEITV